MFFGFSEYKPALNIENYAEYGIVALNFLLAMALLVFGISMPDSHVLLVKVSLLALFFSISMCVFHIYLREYKKKIQNGFRIIINALDKLHLSIAFIVFLCICFISSFDRLLATLSMLLLAVCIFEIFVDVAVFKYRKQRHIYRSINPEDKRQNYEARVLISIGLSIAGKVISLGKVKLPFEIPSTAVRYYLDEWVNCLPYIEDDKDKVKFAFMKIFDACLIVFDYGIIRRHINILNKLKCLLFRRNAI